MKRVQRKAWLLTAMLLPFTAALAGEEETSTRIPEFRTVETTYGVTVWLRMSEDKSRADAFVIRAGTDEASVICPIPTDREKLGELRIGLVPRLDDKSRLEAMDVVTWRKVMDEESAPGNDLRAVAGEKTKRIEVADHLKVAPLWTEDDDRRRIDSFELSALVTRREESPERGEIDPTSRPSNPEPKEDESADESEDKPVEYRKVVLPMPLEPMPDRAYGIILTPVWKKAGVSLTGFDAVLAIESPAKAPKN